MRRHAVLVEVLSKANFEQGIGYQKVTLGSMAKRGESEMGGEKANEGSVKKRAVIVGDRDLLPPGPPTDLRNTQMFGFFFLGLDR